ncbi:hypothetical protein Gohar_021422, partial [Gossypium harknessii]|nr:hypothetical protein [Gossypium harknessii]
FQAPSSWNSLCIDGAVQIASENATTGGVVRNGTGEWIMGYNKNLCKCSIFDVELWGILNCLTLIRYMSYDGVRIQSNSMEVVKAIQDFSPPSSNYALVRLFNTCW